MRAPPFSSWAGPRLGKRGGPPHAAPAWPGLIVVGALAALLLAGCGECRYASDLWYGRCNLVAYSDEDVRVLAPWVPVEVPLR